MHIFFDALTGQWIFVHRAISNGLTGRRKFLGGNVETTHFNVKALTFAVNAD